MEEDDLVDLGGIKVPSVFKTRWDELITKNKEMKVALFEAKTQLQEATTAVSPELETAKARILELEGVVSKSEHSKALSADGVDGDEELYDYLQYQYGKVEEKDGKPKPGFGDWYADVKTKNGVIKAAISAATTAKAEAAAGAAAGTKPGTKPAAGTGTNGTKVVASTVKTVPEKKPASTEAGMDAEAIGSMDPTAWKANKSAIRKQLFGS